MSKAPPIDDSGMPHSTRFSTDSGPTSTTKNLPPAKIATHALARSALGSGADDPHTATRSASSASGAALTEPARVLRRAVEDPHLHVRADERGGAPDGHYREDRGGDGHGPPRTTLSRCFRRCRSCQARKCGEHAELDRQLDRVGADAAAADPTDHPAHDDGAHHGRRSEDPGAAPGPGRGGAKHRHAGEQASEIGPQDRGAARADRLETQGLGGLLGGRPDQQGHSGESEACECYENATDARECHGRCSYFAGG